jgi:hypothetical protein
MRGVRRRTTASFRPAIEALETRNLLSTYLVDHLTDDLVGEGLSGSLRYCITNAADGDDIEFGVSGTIRLGGALPALTQSITLTGPGANAVIVSGNNTSRVFNIAATATVAISGLTIADGHVDIRSDGGGIFNAGALTVTDSAFSGNFGGGGGGIYNMGTLAFANCTFTGNSAGSGGSLFNDQGLVTVADSAFTSNSAVAGGGIYCGSGMVTVIDSTLNGNSASGEAGGGGGIYNVGTLIVTGSFLSDNSANTNSGGGIANFLLGTATVTDSTLGGNSAFNGGAIANSATMTITGSALSDNHAVGGGAGGGIFNDILGMLTVTNSTLIGNSASGSAGGGGILNNQGTATVAESTFSGNHALFGGAIDGRGSGTRGTVTITDSTLTANSATTDGGAIDNFFGGTLTVANSTLSGNSAAAGGAIYVRPTSTATVTNSTLAGNSAGTGGGIDNEGGALTLTDSTLSGNSATTTCGGLDQAGSGTTTVGNTVVAGNTAPSSPDVSGSLASQGYNLIGDGTGASGFAGSDLVGTPDSPIDPLLGPLEDNGGPTQTIALLPASPALNAGDPAQLSTGDQRGVVRTGAVNIGAYQASATGFVLTAPDTGQAGLPFDVTVTAVDPFGQVAVGYTGTVTFSSTDPDPGVVLPADYAFTLDNGGVHTFTDTGLGETTLVSAGNQMLMVTDTADNTITGTAIITVGGPTPEPGRVGEPPLNRLQTSPVWASEPPPREVLATHRWFTALNPTDLLPDPVAQPGER